MRYLDLDCFLSLSNYILKWVFIREYQWLIWFVFKSMIFLKIKISFRVTTTTHREIYFEIILNQPEIRLYLPFSDWFRVDLIWFRKDFYVCSSAADAFTGKTTIIRRIAVRETIASLGIIGDQLIVPLKLPRPSKHCHNYHVKGFNGSSIDMTHLAHIWTSLLDN